MMDWSAAGWIIMSFGMVLFWGLVILGIVWIARTLAHDERRDSEYLGPKQERSALELLDRSLAEGTIDVQDYEKRRRVLTGST